MLLRDLGIHSAADNVGKTLIRGDTKETTRALLVEKNKVGALKTIMHWGVC